MLYILIILIFIRPFISSLSFLYIDSFYYFMLLEFFLVWFLLYGPRFKEIKIPKLPCLLFSLSIIISLIFSQDKLKSAGEIYKYICYLSIFLIAASLKYEEKIKIVNAIILASFIISLLAIYQYFFGFKHILNYTTKEKIAPFYSFVYTSQRRAFFPFVSPNALAGFLMLIIPPALLLQGRKKLAVIICLFLALLLTKSLSAFLSLFFGIIFFLYLRRGPDKAGTLPLLILGLCLIIIILVLRQTLARGDLLPSLSFERRLTYWQDTIKLIKAHPFFGVGIGNFDLPLSRYAHNVFLQIWAEMGILGLISFIWLIIATLKTALQKITLPSSKIMTTALTASSIAFLIHNLFDFTFFLPEISLIWWALLGLTLAC
jgi:putative inorganic carbon (hco3(-)) transporter